MTATRLMLETWWIFNTKIGFIIMTKIPEQGNGRGWDSKAALTFFMPFPSVKITNSNEIFWLSLEKYIPGCQKNVYAF